MLYVSLLISSMMLAGCDNLAQWAFNAAVAAEQERAGLHPETLTTDDGIQWHVLVSNAHQQKPAVLLVHGFGADSSNWVRFANELEGDYYFVIPDLPGHGESTRSLDLDYRSAAQARRLLTLMDKLGIDRFHVAGNSMGGAISLAVEQQASQRVLSMGLIDSAGLTRQTPAFTNLLATSDSNPLIPHSPEEFRTTLKWAMEDPPYLPDFFVEVMGNMKAANAPVAEKIWKDLHDDPGMSLEDTGKLEKMKVPTLVLWGRQDRLLDLSNVKAFTAELPQARSVVLDGIGHVPMAEAPQKTADAFRVFWREASAG
ncbi:carboxylic ester hydrolase [Alcanivorax hongdengensis A-11-3]|uniref:Carboxylic ester hydrolase n=1 Tax=Alcanivorax hongdengensis A-11-3 TaxID=1177179 RepID=L0WAE3_9GAMM|nr:carboxylic ester hydrolase [Alcanivorax hongdengensis A-11-3]